MMKCNAHEMIEDAMKENRIAHREIWDAMHKSIDRMVGWIIAGMASMILAGFAFVLTKIFN